ncbi:hypothetical protein BDZ91DRAFT_847512 [Kalaharituber pfeilii]|nr:hypothetical protein BDZ91DRAFT_847512 [Kalaharituber pfeilii]
MPESTSIRSSYVRYKESTQKLVRWLVTTVSSIPDISDDKAQHQGPAKPKKKGSGKQKKGKKSASSSLNITGEPVISIRNFTEYAKIIAQHKGQFEVPEGVYSLLDSVIHARRMVASFYKQLDTSPETEAKNQSHMNFIHVLEEAFDILGGSLWRQTSTEERAKARMQGKQTPDGLEDTALRFSNRFADLEVEYRDLGVEEEEEEQPNSQPCNEWIADLVGKQSAKGSKRDKSSKSGKVSLSSYKISDDLTAKEEMSFAVWCFFVDMNSIRQYLKALWNQVRKDNIDLVTASVVTSLAVETIVQLEANLQLSFPQLKDYPSLMRALLTELPIAKIQRVLELLDFCLFFPVHSVCGFRARVLRTLPKLESKELKEIGEIADKCGLNGRRLQTSIAQAKKIQAEADFLDQYLFKLMLATEHADRTKPQNEPRLGMTAFHHDFEEFFHLGKLKTRMAFSLQLLLDIRNILPPKKSPKKLQFSHTLKYVRSQQDNLRREIKRIEEKNGPLALKRSLNMFIAHVENWIGFGRFIPSGQWEDITFPDMKKDFLSENPWHLGLVYAEVSVQLFSMASFHSSISLPSILHLYNFLIHVQSIVPGVDSLEPIPLLELLCEAFGKHIFQGSRPTTNFSTRFAISSRKEISMLASDAHRRSRGQAMSAKQFEKLTLPPIMSTLHGVVADCYKLHGRAYSWIEKAAQSATDNIELKSPKREKRDSLLRTLSPAQLLDRVCEALWTDFNGSVPIGRVDMLKVRELCTRLRSAVYQKVRWDFVSRLGQQHPDQFREEEEFDLTPSILEIEKYAEHREVQRKIVNGVMEVFRDVFEGVGMEDYFGKIPMARRKGWRQEARKAESQDN